jgi:hypothetical protein
MSTETPSKSTRFHWSNMKGLVASVLFLVIAILAEYVVVLYAMSLGAKDQSLLQWTFKFPGTSWDVTLAISPLFHLVPISVIITLVSSWIYLKKNVAVKPYEVRKEKFAPVSKRGKEKRTRFFTRIRDELSKSIIGSALAVFMVFALFILTVSLLAYPQLIYQTIANAYGNNPSLLNFVKGSGEALAPIGSIFAGIDNALLPATTGFRDFVLGLGGLISPLANLDNDGKYLVLQNASAWICALLVLFYGEFGRKLYRYKKK